MTEQKQLSLLDLEKNESHFIFLDYDIDELSTTIPDAREMIAFRLSKHFDDIVDNFLSSFSPTLSVIKDNTLLKQLKMIEYLSHDADTAYQLGIYGVHSLLRKILKSVNIDQYEDIADEINDIIGITIASGCMFPIAAEMERRHYISHISVHHFHPPLGLGLSLPNSNIYLRKVPDTMHGKGQLSVGYILWPAAVILSR